jgi:hypothetical protein
VQSPRQFWKERRSQYVCNRRRDALPTGYGRPWSAQGVVLAHGTEVRIEHLGRVFHGRIEDGEWAIIDQKRQEASGFEPFTRRRASVQDRSGRADEGEWLAALGKFESRKAVFGFRWTNSARRRTVNRS